MTSAAAKYEPNTKAHNLSLVSNDIASIFFVTIFENRFGQSTARYATFLAVGVVLAEMGTNSLTDYLWEANNKGKTYKQVDWSKFDPQDEDEDEDDDDDDDDDDDEDEDDE